MKPSLQDMASSSKSQGTLLPMCNKVKLFQGDDCPEGEKTAIVYRSTDNGKLELLFSDVELQPDRQEQEDDVSCPGGDERREGARIAE